MFRFDLASFDCESERCSTHEHGISPFRQIHPPFPLTPVLWVYSDLARHTEVREVAVASCEANNGKGDSSRQSPSQIAVKLGIKCHLLQGWIGLLCDQLN